MHLIYHFKFRVITAIYHLIPLHLKNLFIVRFFSLFMDLLPVLKIQRLLPHSQLTLSQPGICRELHAPKATSLSLKPPACAEPFCLCGAGLEGLTLGQDTQHQTHSAGGPRRRRVGPAPHCSQTLSVPCQVIHTMTTRRPWPKLWENVGRVLHNGQDVEVGHWKYLQVLGLKRGGISFPLWCAQ